MAEDQLPRGKAGLPRFSDIGPLVSHHNTPATECDIEHCFDGHSKGEVIRSIRDAYKIYKNGVEREFEDIIEEFVGVFLVGSVARGNFGCRAVDSKIFGLVNGEVMIDMRDKPISEDEVSRRLDIAQRNADNAPEYVNNIQNEFGDFLDRSTAIQIEKFACSDIDIFVYTELPEDIAERMDDELFLEMLERLVPEAENEIVGEMGIEPGVKSINELERPAITSVDEFNQLIKRYYND